MQRNHSSQIINKETWLYKALQGKSGVSIFTQRDSYNYAYSSFNNLNNSTVQMSLFVILRLKLKIDHTREGVQSNHEPRKLTSGASRYISKPPKLFLHVQLSYLQKQIFGFTSTKKSQHDKKSFW